MKQQAIVATILAALWALPAASLTMTFNAGALVDLDGDFSAESYVEDGITMTGFLGGAIGDGPGRAHLDNPSNGHFTDTLSFRTGGRFALGGFDVIPFDNDCTNGLPCPPFPNVRVAGFRAGALVVAETFDMTAVGGRYTGGPAFADMDALKISALDAVPFPGVTYETVHFDIDNLTLIPATAGGDDLAQVPVPGGVLMLLTGLVGLGLIGWHRR